MEVTFKDVHGNEVRIGSRIRLIHHYNVPQYRGELAKVVWDEQHGMLKYIIDSDERFKTQHNFYSCIFELAHINCKHEMVRTFRNTAGEQLYNCTKCDYTEIE